MAVAKKIAFNVFFNSAAKAVSTVLALVAIGFITRYLGRDGFGDYATVLAFFAFFTAIADLGLYAITTREISRPDAPEEKIIGKIFTLRLTASLTVFLLAPAIAFFLPYPRELKVGIIISAAAFVFTSAYGLLNGVFQKNIAMNRVALAEVLGKIVQVALVILAVRKDWGFTAIVLAFFISSAVNAILVFALSRRFVRFGLDFDWKYWKKFLQESFPMGLAVIITFLYFKLDTILLSMMRSSAEVGIYNAAYKVIENLTFFPAMVIGLIFPLMARYIFNDRKKFIEVSDQTFKIFLILAVPILISVLFLAEKIIALIGGAGFAESAGVLRILVFALFFIFFGNFFNNLLIAGNLQKKMMQVLFFCALFNVSANFLVIPRFSYVGAAATSALTEMLVVASTAFLTWRHLRYRPRFRNLPGTVASAGAMALLLYFGSGLNFFVLVILGAATYFSALWITRTITNQELRLIFSRKESTTIDLP